MITSFVAAAYWRFSSSLQVQRQRFMTTVWCSEPIKMKESKLRVRWVETSPHVIHNHLVISLKYGECKSHKSAESIVRLEVGSQSRRLCDGNSESWNWTSNPTVPEMSSKDCSRGDIIVDWRVWRPTRPFIHLTLHALFGTSYKADLPSTDSEE